MRVSTRSITSELVGREEERSLIRQLLAAAAAGRGGAIVVTGPAGIGRTALLRDAAESAAPDATAVPAEIRIAQVVGTMAERQWPYAGLHLVISTLWGSEAIQTEPADEPADSEDQLAAGGDGAAGLGAASAADLVAYIAGAATPYDAARRAQDVVRLVTRPVLLLVDDAHHFDSQSQEALGFVARRLLGVPVAMVLTTDAAVPVAPFHGLHTVRLGDLPQAEAADLVRRAGGPHVLPAVAAQIATRVGGNPQALLDTVSRIPGRQLMGQVELDRHLPSSPVLQTLHLPELADLDEARRFALLVATGSEDGQLAPVLHALRDQDESVTGWLIAEHLLPSDSGFVLRRPAVRSVIWQAASPSERTRAHETLAAAYAGSDRGQHLWHLAQARQEDDELAGRLEHLARELLDHGELERAMPFARESVRLTPAGSASVGRLLLAGRLALLTGRLDEVVQLTQERFRRDTTASERADLVLLELRARTALDGEVATGLATRHVAEIAGTDPGRAARIAIAAAVSLAGRMDEAEASRFLAVAEQFTDIDDDTASARLRAAAVVASAHGDLERAVELIDRDTAPGGEHGSSLQAGDVVAGAEKYLQHALVLTRAERFERARPLLKAVTADDRIAASPLLLSTAYGELSALELRAGRLNAARAAAASWDRVVSRGVFRTVAPAHVIRIHALAGEYEAAWDWRARAAGTARRHGDSWMTALVQAETGGLLLLLDRLAEAISSLDGARRHALQHVDPAIMPVEPDFIEACVRAGELDRARSALADFAARTTRVPTAWATHTLQRCRALVSGGEEAVALLEAAADDTVSPIELARTQLCLGDWLRRLSRRAESWEWLRRARALAHQAGATALVTRAEDALRPLDAGVARTMAQLSGLTEAEQRVAGLVAAGRRNREIAAELFISERTVEAHLGRIFRKVGVRSRTELASAVITANDGTS